MRTKAFAYLRVSGRGQLDGDGFDRQLLACQEYAAAANFEIVEVFHEKGVPGKTELDNRPALGELFAALQENGVRTVIIEKLDRLARDLIVQENIVADFMKSGFTLVSACEPDLCSNDPSRVLVRQIFGAIAQYDKAMIVMKLRGARLRYKAKHGKCEGRKAFGERPEEQEALARIVEWRSMGESLMNIADLLNATGIPTRSGGPWRISTISGILKREAV